MEGKRERKTLHLGGDGALRNRIYSCGVTIPSSFAAFKKASTAAWRSSGQDVPLSISASISRVSMARDASEPLAPVHAFGGLRFHRMVLSKMGNVRRFSRRQGRIPNLKARVQKKFT